MTLRDKNFIVSLFAIILTHLFLSCQSGNISGGLETTNGFIVASNSNGTISGYGKPGTRLTLCDNTYTIQDSANHHIQNQTIDKTGAFIFNTVPSGTYNLFCWDDTERESICIADIASDQNGPLFKDTVELTQTCVISGLAYMRERTKSGITVTIIGSPLWSMTDDSGSYSIADVPKGQFSLYASLSTITFKDTVYFEGESRINVSSAASVIPAIHIWPEQPE